MIYTDVYGTFFWVWTDLEWGTTQGIYAVLIRLLSLVISYQFLSYVAIFIFFNK